MHLKLIKLIKDKIWRILMFLYFFKVFYFTTNHKNDNLKVLCNFRAYILDESKNNVTVLKSHTEPIRCGKYQINFYFTQKNFSSTTRSTWGLKNVIDKCPSVSQIEIDF